MIFVTPAVNVPVVVLPRVAVPPLWFKLPVIVVAPAANAPVTLAAPLTESLFVPSSAPPPITAVESSEAPDERVPVDVLPVVVVLPLTVRFALLTLVPTTVVPAFNVPVLVLPDTSALPFTSSDKAAPAFEITTVGSTALLFVNCAASPVPMF